MKDKMEQPNELSQLDRENQQVELVLLSPGCLAEFCSHLLLNVLSQSWSDKVDLLPECDKMKFWGLVYQIQGLGYELKSLPFLHKIPSLQES